MTVDDALLGDIRLLKLAEMYERAYETFVLEMAEKYVHDDEVKARLRKLADPADGHGERIAAQLERLNRKLGEVDRAALTRAALQDVIEVERAARAFYLRFVEEVHDPEAAALFRDLAREEDAHVRIAEDALARSDKKAGRPSVSAAVRMLRLLEAPPGWEGTSDFGRSRRTDAARPEHGRT